MTKLKKVVAVMLAFLMIFSSASVFASAWDATTDDGSNLSIATKFFKNVGGEWVETTKVKPNDVVKARVYLGTDYYSNDSALLFFYDKDFFTHSYASAPTEVDLANTEAGSFAAENNVTTVVMANPNLKTQVNNGYIDTAFTDAYGAISVVVKVNAGNESNVKYDNSTWLFELELTVKEDAAATDGIGDLFVKDTTVQNSTTQTNAVVNVPKGPADGTDADIWAMWLWDANVTLSSQPVSTNSSVTFNANTGAFAADDTETFFTEGQIGTAIADAIPAISKDGYSFMGWVDATDTTPTYEEIVTAPTNYPEADLVLNAYWMENVDITFETDGGTAIPTLTGVTPYAEFADIADPTKAGYTFKGWDVKGGDLPDTYPDVDTTYTAIWAKNVVVSFDTDGADPIEAIPGAAGDPFTATINDPVKEGHYFTGWTPALPTVFPEQDTTYTATYDTKNYMVNYNVDGKFAATAQIEYGQKIPTSVPTIKVPAGKILSDWYTDAACTVKLDENATMGAKSITLYAKTSNRTYNAIFNANGGSWADGETTKTVLTAFDADIDTTTVGLTKDDAAAPTREGYTFVGWDPYVGTMDAEGMTFTAQWIETADAYTVTYIVDGNTEKPYQVFTLALNDEFEIPADPDKEGYTFDGWEDAETGTVYTVEELAALKMPAKNLTYHAVFSVNNYTATFYNYEEFLNADGVAVSPWKTDVPVAIEATGYDYGKTIVFPADPTNINSAYWTFVGWSTEEDGEVIADTSDIPMGAADVAYYAVYEKVAVKLVPAEGSTTVIERTIGTKAYKESHAAGSVTATPYKDIGTVDPQQSYIYGLAPRMKPAALETEKNTTYVEVLGDGYTVVTPVVSARLGTGTLVEVKDRNGTEDISDDFVVEQFYVVIFGDLDGNSLVNLVDSGLLVAEVDDPEWSARTNRVYYKFKAANLDGSRTINGIDSSLLINVADAMATIDQVTGTVNDN